MQQSFASAAANTEAFIAFTAVGSGAVLAMALVAGLLLSDRDRRLHFKTLAVLVPLGVTCVVLAGYQSTFARFVAAEIDPTQVRLKYDGPFAHVVVLPRERVETFLFGAPDKSNYRCYLKVVATSGQDYRSATLDVPLSTCKELRVGFLRVLQGGA